jgi:type II secretory pathway component PulF
MRGLRFRIPLGSRAQRQEQVAEFARYLALLLRAGVPLAEGLDVLTRHHSGRFGVLLRQLRDRITGGIAFAEALAAHTEWFDQLFVSAVRVGELSGNLEQALDELAEHLRRQEGLRGRLTQTLTYPVILLVLGVSVVIFLMTYVIPQLLTVLEVSGRGLPLSTLVLKRLSDVLVGYWPFLLAGAVLLVGGFSAWQHTATGKRYWQRTQLRLPLVGPLVRKSVVARFAQQMAILLKTGVPFVEAVRTVAVLTSNVVLADELATIGTAVESGSDIAPTMKDSRIFPPVVVHLVAVGQHGGTLTELLDELRIRYETEVRLAMDKFTAALEPALIVLLAAAVGFVVFACLMPILEATRGIA